MANLPYVTSPGNIERALNGIKSASTPELVSQDFVKTILKIPGGSGDQITSYLKKIGFANPDGSPSSIYKKFRNPATSGIAAAESLRKGYGSLFTRNEYMYRLADLDLRGLIIEETGQSDDSSVPGLVLAAINTLRRHADFDSSSAVPKVEPELPTPPAVKSPEPNRPELGMNLSYTINLNLPATPDIEVFNAIFKSLKENLLRGSNA